MLRKSKIDAPPVPLLIGRPPFPEESQRRALASFWSSEALPILETPQTRSHHCTEPVGDPADIWADVGAMDADAFSNSKTEEPLDVVSFQGERRKLIQPTSLQDPKVEKLKEVLVSWINKTLTPDHIVVQSLEEDLYDGLVLHHLLARLAGVSVSVEEIALTAAAQVQKLGAVLEKLNERLGTTRDDALAKWDVKLIHNKDLLATLHLLVSMVRCFQPDLALPTNVKVDVILVEVNKTGIKSDTQSEYLTEESKGSNVRVMRFLTRYWLSVHKGEDPIDQLLKLDTHKIVTAKTAILNFVNQKVSSMGLQVADLDTQFSDGVILLLLIGQLEGFFVPLCDFHLSPASHSEMVHNVTLACDLLLDLGVNISTIDPQDIISRDVRATLKVLYSLFRRHKGRQERPADTQD
ncbi:Gamma-parvin [Merluccius polli]|uniref:Gamma-parvin n=1 Tax=Merluccius polli TaxID=89951 RepID=A0AA47N4N3_MERPO|nr:Gamma-parvin [Merluccius polli]